MRRLHPDHLEDLSPDVQLPSAPAGSRQSGIVHLGLGAFHRAHQAVLTERAMRNSGGDWGIIGVSMRSAAVSEQLMPQGCLYSVMSEDDNGPRLELVAAINEVLVAPDQPERVVAAIADPAVKVVTLTITEKAYYLAADGESLNIEQPEIRSDLATPERPVSALGLLALGLRQRCRNNGGPLTVISCDNLAQNSYRLQRVLGDYLQATFAEVLPWLQQAVRFPCSMVDRIVPAMGPEQRARQANLLGLRDEGAVTTEPFIQWIIEDNFAGSIPDWQSAGVAVVANIHPYEEIKLRLLNASHSAIAYAGLLAGQETVADVMADPALASFVEQLMAEELLPALNAPAGFNLAEYRDQLLARFGNSCLRHRCSQIAMDGSEKIGQRWLATLQGNPDAALLPMALSFWCYFILRTQHPIEDPQMARLMKLRASPASLEPRLVELLDCARINGQTVKHFEQLLPQVLDQMRLIDEIKIAGLLRQRQRPG